MKGDIGIVKHRSHLKTNIKTSKEGDYLLEEGGLLSMKVCFTWVNNEQSYGLKFEAKIHELQCLLTVSDLLTQDNSGTDRL